MNFIRVAKNRWQFEKETSSEKFVPVGSTYCAVIAGIKEGGYCGQIFPLFGIDENTEPDPVKEGIRAFRRLADLGMNLVRIWLEPNDFFPVGIRLNPENADRLDDLINAGKETGIYLCLGMHLAPIASGWRMHSFEPPHNQRLLEHIYLLGKRWGNEPQIFSWSIVGEATLPWQTEWIVSQWPGYLQYWYNDDIELLKKAWGPWLKIRHFKDAPIPPQPAGLMLGKIDAVNPGNLKNLPPDPWADSTWRYDWRIFLEEIGSRRVRNEVRALREAGARQMITVGNNCWTFPNLPCGQMAMGYNPYFYLDVVDYLCLHNYPAPQCLPGGNGDPLDSEEAMKFWLIANEVMGRIYGSMGKPVILEEWGWYGGGESSFLCKLPYRSEEDHLRYCDRMIESTLHSYSGWIYWQWRDMPKSTDISNYSGLYDKTGNRIKPWGSCYAEWAETLKKNPPIRTEAKSVVELPMRGLYTSDLFHETWWQKTCQDYSMKNPLDFSPHFEHKPMTDVQMDLRN